MFLIIVYDTDRKKCAKVHKYLKKYVSWNQNSVFEGTVTKAQYYEIKNYLEKTRAKDSHIIIYSLENTKLLTKQEIGGIKGGSENIL
jgi:CRISPR-associated protein Cas2